MKTAIVYYSRHHENTKKVLDAIAANHEVTLIDVLKTKDVDLTEYDRIGFASGIYFSKFAAEVLAYATNVLPAGKDVFYIATCGSIRKNYFDAISKIAADKGCKELGRYICKGFDTYGPFKLVGGIAKGHPDESEIADAVKFYEGL